MLKRKYFDLDSTGEIDPLMATFFRLYFVYKYDILFAKSLFSGHVTVYFLLCFFLSTETWDYGVGVGVLGGGGGMRRRRVRRGLWGGTTHFVCMKVFL